MNTQAAAPRAPGELASRLDASLRQRARELVDAAILPIEGRIARELGEALEALSGPTIKGKAMAVISRAIDELRDHAVNCHHERLASAVIEQLTNGHAVDIPAVPRAADPVSTN